MSYNMMIGYDIYDRFTMEHFLLRQSMILTTSFFCSRQYIRESRVRPARDMTFGGGVRRPKTVGRVHLS
jgi:hypothetical protein